MSCRVPLPHRLALPAVLALCVLASGCLIDSDSETEYYGQYVSEETLAEIQPGSSKQFVLAVLGEPTRRVDVDETDELWKWEYRQETSSSGTVFLLLSSRRTTGREGAVWVRFDGEKVQRIWRDGAPPVER